MLKLILLSVLVIVALGKDKTCQLQKGKKMVAFSGSREDIKFPCKFNAVKDTACGKFTSITVTPDLKLTARSNGKYVYVVESMFVSAETTKESVSVRTQMNKVEKFLDGTEAEFASTKSESSKDMAKKMFKQVKGEKPNEVLLEAEGFTVSFRLYIENKVKTTGMSFTCHSDTFEPNQFPLQLCGNGTRNEVREMKEEEDVRDNRRAIIVYSVFGNKYIEQTSAECKEASKAMTKTTDDLAMEAAINCWPITYKAKFINTLITDETQVDRPITVFKDCVKFVSSNYTDTASCGELKASLGRLKLKTVTSKIDDVC